MVGWEVGNTVKETMMSGYSLLELRTRVTSRGESGAAPEGGNTGGAGEGEAPKAASRRLVFAQNSDSLTSIGY